MAADRQTLLPAAGLSSVSDRGVFIFIASWHFLSIPFVLSRLRSSIKNKQKKKKSDKITRLKHFASRQTAFSPSALARSDDPSVSTRLLLLLRGRVGKEEDPRSKHRPANPQRRLVPPPPRSVCRHLCSFSDSVSDAIENQLETLRESDRS